MILETHIRKPPCSRCEGLGKIIDRHSPNFSTFSNCPSCQGRTNIVEYSFIFWPQGKMKWAIWPTFASGEMIPKPST